MRKSKIFLGVALAAAVLFTSCGDDPQIKEVSSIELNKKTLSLEVGQSETLTAEVLPADAADKSVAWTSSNASVASVANGKVTANSAGNALIIAKAGNKADTCAVIVENAVLPDEDGVLINGVVWAKCNVDNAGAFVENPEDYGGYYPWSEALTVCPSGWRLPTKDELLINLADDYQMYNVTNVTTTVNGIKGRRFTDRVTGNNIFLPAAGYYVRAIAGQAEFVFVGLEGHYLSSTGDNSSVYCLWFGINNGSGYFVEALGYASTIDRSVRCVKE